MELHILAPAKVNLSLRVLGKRPDGYHELATLFQRVSLCDRLRLRRRSKGLTLSCSLPELASEDNLVLKAARLLQTRCPHAPGAEIELEKRVPVAAGLGGGSSDAASTLVGLNILWQLGLGKRDLLDLGAKLGADVPFFLHDCAYAWGTGRGDVCAPITTRRTLHLVIAALSATLSTREVFQGASFGLTASGASDSLLQTFVNNGSLSELAEGMSNDLEPEAIRRCPLIADVQSRLLHAGCLASRVSGSGPTVYGLCRDAEHALQVAGALHDPTLRLWPVATLFNSIIPGGE